MLGTMPDYEGACDASTPFRVGRRRFPTFVKETRKRSRPKQAYLKLCRVLGRTAQNPHGYNGVLSDKLGVSELNERQGLGPQKQDLKVPP